MSLNSKKKAAFLRSLNRNPVFLKKRAASRRVHDEIVQNLVERLRYEGMRCYTLSEYVKEERTPDAILFDGKKLVALEVEQEKRYKASNAAIRERLEMLNSKSGFFDSTLVAFVPEGAKVDDLMRQLSNALSSKR